jgi:phage baseplate assembly protein W
MATIRDLVHQAVGEQEAERLMSELARAIRRYSDARVALARTSTLPDAEIDQRFAEVDRAEAEVRALLGRFDG